MLFRLLPIAMARLTDIFHLSIPWWLEIGAGFLLGAIIGSYLATILWRWPRGKSANTGRSHCDACSRPLEWYELIPLIGPWLVGLRCAGCNTRIDLGHSALELACAVAGAYCFIMGMVWIAPFVWLLIVLAWFDARHLWLPNALVAILAVAAFFAPISDDLSRIEQLVGGAVGFGVLWLLSTTYRLLRGRDGLGGGDAKLLGAIGLSVGALELPVIVAIACGIGLLDAAIRVRRGANRATVQLPLGTYLCCTTIAYAALAAIA